MQYSAKYYLDKGNMFRYSDNFAQAIIEYKQAIELDETLVDAYKGIGDCYKEMGNYEKSIVYYKKAVEVDPQSAGLCYLLGNSYEMAGFFEKALESYAESLKKNPSDQLVRTERKLTFDIISMQKKLINQPNDIFLMVDIGKICFQKGLIEQAYKVFVEAYKLAPKNLEILRYLSNIFILQKKHKDAVVVLKKILSIDDNLLDDKYQLGEVYYNINNFIDAIAIWTELKDKYQELKDVARLRTISEKIRIANRRLEGGI